MRKLSTAIGLLAVSALILTGCAAGESADENSITIGLLAPLTGPSAADGEGMQQGAELAIKEINAAGGVDGVTLKLKVADVQDQKSDAVNAGVEEMITDDSVKAVVTGYASTTNFEIDKFAAAEMIYLIGGNTAQTEGIISKNPEKYPTVWSITPNYDAYNTGPVDLVNQWAEDGLVNVRDKDAFIIKSDNPYSAGIADGLAKEFEATGWSIAAMETIPFGAVNDWQTQISKIRQVDPAYVINTDYQVSNEVTFMQQFTQNPSDSLIFIQYGPSVEEFLTSAGDAANGVLYNNLAGHLESPDYAPAQTLIAKWDAEYKTKAVPPQGMITYEEVMLYADALKSVGDANDKLAIAKVISTSDKEVAGGRLLFDQETHLSMQGDDYIPLQSFQIIDGKRVLIAPAKYKTGDFVLPPWMKK